MSFTKNHEFCNKLNELRDTVMLRR